MSGFAPSSAGVAGLDPSKRVNYRFGLVLGEDEFRQDQFHLRERDQHATRALHGYGTVSGLGVHHDDASGRLKVSPGLAVDAAGRLICVPVDYCGSLRDWVLTQVDDGVSGLPAGPLSVYVLLCWHECATDEVPIPAGSCLSAEDSRAASRLQDSFELKLSLEPPPAVGEVASTSLGDGLDDLVEELHGLLDVSGSSPVDTVGVAALLREWAVERRPEVVAGLACLPPPDDTCVLLARVDVVLADGASGLEIDSAVVDDTDRPILVSTRLLQEALFAVAADEEVPEHHHALADLADVDLTAPPAIDDCLVFDGADWVAGTVDVVTDHGDLTGLGLDDHPQYLLVNGTRPLTGDLSAGGNRLLDLPPSAAPGQPVVEGQTAGGDLQDTYPDPRLASIQGIAVDAPSVLERDVLAVRGGQWVPALPTTLPLATITPHEKERHYVVWFNLDAPENAHEVDPATLDAGLTIHRETDAGPSFLRLVGPTGISQVMRNVFLVEVREDATPLRFTFDLDQVKLTGGEPISQLADESGVNFEGQTAKRNLVTRFVLRADRVG